MKFIVGNIIIFGSLGLAGTAEKNGFVLHPIYWYLWGGVSCMIGMHLITAYLAKEAPHDL